MTRDEKKVACGWQLQLTHALIPLSSSTAQNKLHNNTYILSFFINYTTIIHRSF